MFYLFLGGLIGYITIFLILKLIKRMYKLRINNKSYHFFILVENGEEKIEWTIRSIMFNNWFEGREKKLTVIDLGSVDDTLPILERLTYRKAFIDRLYLSDGQDISLDELIENSKENGEEPIILFISDYNKSNKIVMHGKKIYKTGGIS